MHTKIITTREQELTEGNYVEGVVVQFLDKYFWLLANGDCTETTVSCLLYTSPSPRDLSTSRMPSSA